VKYFILRSDKYYVINESFTNEYSTKANNIKKSLKISDWDRQKDTHAA